MSNKKSKGRAALEETTQTQRGRIQGQRRPKVRPEKEKQSGEKIAEDNIRNITERKRAEDCADGAGRGQAPMTGGRSKAPKQFEIANKTRRQRWTEHKDRPQWVSLMRDSLWTLICALSTTMTMSAAN
jgi:hypothetical protein